MPHSHDHNPIDPSSAPGSRGESIPQNQDSNSQNSPISCSDRRSDQTRGATFYLKERGTSESGIGHLALVNGGMHHSSTREARRSSGERVRLHRKPRTKDMTESSRYAVVQLRGLRRQMSSGSVTDEQLKSLLGSRKWRHFMEARSVVQSDMKDFFNEGKPFHSDSPPKFVLGPCERCAETLSFVALSVGRHPHLKPQDSWTGHASCLKWRNLLDGVGLLRASLHNTTLPGSFWNRVSDFPGKTLGDWNCSNRTILGDLDSGKERHGLEVAEDDEGRGGDDKERKRQEEEFTAFQKAAQIHHICTEIMKRRKQRETAAQYGPPPRDV